MDSDSLNGSGGTGAVSASAETAPVRHGAKADLGLASSAARASVSGVG